MLFRSAQQRGNLADELGYRYKDVKDGYYQSFYSTDDELNFSSYLAKKVFREYEKNPMLCAKCMGLNLFNFWFTGKSATSTAINVLVQLPYLILAVIGSVLCLKNKRFTTIGPLVLFILYVMAVHVPILAQARYSVPLVPLLSILASFVFVAKRKSVHSISAAVTLHGGDCACTPIAAVSLAGCGTEKP